jgi:hypothetical protein
MHTFAVDTVLPEAPHQDHHLSSATAHAGVSHVLLMVYHPTTLRSVMLDTPSPQIGSILAGHPKLPQFSPHFA